MSVCVQASGTVAFKAGDYEEALESYEDATGYLDYGEKAEGKEEECQTMYMSCTLNGAQCCIKQGEFSQAVDLCTRALMRDESNVKALFRRGQARMHMGEWAEAKADLRQASTLDPKNKEVRDAFAEVGKKEAAAKKADKAMYSKMFG